MQTKSTLLQNALLAGIMCFGLSALAQQVSTPPVNPDATPAARQLLTEIDAVSGKGILSGQHNFPNTISRYSDRMAELSGHYPAVFGVDFGFSAGEDKDSVQGRPSMIQEAIRQYRAGAVIAVTWHAVRPTEDEPVTFLRSVQGKLSDWEFQQLVTPGTDLHRRWEQQVDVIAGYLRQLQDANVPVLFRPYHEMNGNWFWWGGRPGPQGTQLVYKMIYDRFVHVHHLNNLVWIWNVNAPSANAGPVDQYYPGDAYVDVVTEDNYGAFTDKLYQDILAVAHDTKPVAFAEVGGLPSQETLAAQPRWAYLMTWSGINDNLNDSVRAFYDSPRTIHRGDARLPKPLPPSAEQSVPADLEATTEAKALLQRLHTATSHPLTGAAASAGETNPSCSGGILEITFDKPTDTLARTVRDAAKNCVVDLRWLPASPTGSPKLDDYEWNQLLQPGSSLHAAFQSDIAAVNAMLKKLQNEHVALLWTPLPGVNSPANWYGGHPGASGSATLLRDVQTGVPQHNLLWNWEITPTGLFGGGTEAYSPGLLHLDAVTWDLTSVTGGRLRPMNSMGKLPGLRIASGATNPGTAAWVISAPATLPAPH